MSFQDIIAVMMITLSLSCNKIEQQKKNKKDTRLTTYYSNGTLKTDFGIDSMGRKQGICYWYYPNGNKDLVTTYHKGKPIETISSFYKDGRIKYLGLYDLKSQYRYNIEFDSIHQRVTHEEGKSLYAIIRNKEKINYGDTVEIEVHSLFVDGIPTDFKFIYDNDSLIVKEKNKVPLFRYEVKKSNRNAMNIRIMNEINLKKNHYQITDTLYLTIPIQ